MTDSTFAVSELGTWAPAGTVLRDPPSISFTAPLSVVNGSQVTVAWNYLSPVGKPQAWFQVALSTAASAVLFESPEIPGTATSYTIPFELLPFSTYIVTVTVSDNIDTNGGQEIQFSTAAVTGAASSPTNTEVGSVYEVAVNGVGLMMADRPGSQQNYTSQAALITPERLVTGDTPYSESFDRYSSVGFDDWAGGEGQLYRDKERSDPARFWQSVGVDPFSNDGELRLLQEPDGHILNASAQRAVVADGTVYVDMGDGNMTALDAPGGTPVSWVETGAGTTFGLASDGKYWYRSNSTDIFRNDTAADSGAAWSTTATTHIEWVGDRLAAFNDLVDPPLVTTFAPDGTEEVPGGRFFFPEASLRGLAGGGGYMWWGVNRGDVGQVYAWNLGSSDGAFVALTVPAGESVSSVYYYLGNVMLGTTLNTNVHRIYRCVPGGDGTLNAQFVVEVPVGLGGAAEFAGSGNLIAFGWNDMVPGDGFDGIGVINLESGGIARWYYGPSGPGITSVVRWHGDFGFVQGNVGFFGKNADDRLYPSGHLDMSVTDLASSIVKSISAVSVRTGPLPSGSKVEVGLSTDRYASVQPVASLATAGATSLEHRMSRQNRSFGARVTLFRGDPDTTTGPSVQSLTLDMYPYGGPNDEIVNVPVWCADRLSGMSGQPLKENAAGAGIRRARWLRSLLGQDVKFQDVDWPITRSEGVYQVVAVQHDGLGVLNRRLGRREDGGVVTLTLRRKL